MTDELKPFVSEAPNGFRTYYTASELMQEGRVYRNPVAPLAVLLFEKGTITGRELIDVLSLHDFTRVNDFRE